MKLSRTLYLQRLLDVIRLIIVNGVLIILANRDNIPFILFLTLLFNSLLLYMYSFSWLPEVLAKESHFTSSHFGFKKNYNYQDLITISEVNYEFRFIHKHYTPIKLTFKNKITLVFTPNNDGLENLLNIVKEKSLQVRIDL